VMSPASEIAESLRKRNAAQSSGRVIVKLLPIPSWPFTRTEPYVSWQASVPHALFALDTTCTMQPKNIEV